MQKDTQENENEAQVWKSKITDDDCHLQQNGDSLTGTTSDIQVQTQSDDAVSSYLVIFRVAKQE